MLLLLYILQTKAERASMCCVDVGTCMASYSNVRVYVPLAMARHTTGIASASEAPNNNSNNNRYHLFGTFSSSKALFAMEALGMTRLVISKKHEMHRFDLYKLD
jgi:hypothetical protein